jgi:hypothetical protein
MTSIWAINNNGTWTLARPHESGAVQFVPKVHAVRCPLCDREFAVQNDLNQHRKNNDKCSNISV